MSTAFIEFIAFVKRNSFFYIFGIAGLFLTNFCEVAAPKIMQWLIDLLVSKDTTVIPTQLRGTSILNSLYLLSFLLLGNFISAGLGSAAWREGLARMTHRSGQETRERFWQTLKEIGYARFVRSFTVGDLINRLSQDYNYTRFMHGFNIVETLDLFFFSILALVLMFRIDAELTLYCLLCFTIIPPFIARLARQEYRQHLHAQQELSLLSDLIAQATATIKLQRSSGGEFFWQHKLGVSAREYANRNYQVQKTMWHIFPFSALPVLCSYVLLCMLGLPKITNGQLSLGEFFALASYILLLQSRIYQLNSCISTWQRGFASYGRMLEIIKAKLKKTSKGAAVNFNQPLLEIKSLSFAYEKTYVIKFLTLSLLERQWLGIAGVLGSGKTTTLKCIIGLLPVPDKKIMLFGADINYIPNNMRAKLIAYVPQKIFLFSTTVRENLCLDRQISDNQLWHILDVVQLRAFIESLPQKLDTVIGEWGVDLSGGQKQRLAIGRAILRKPKLLLFDDCFSAIDSITEQKIMEQVRIFLADTAIIWASHRTSSFHFCNKVITMK